MHFKDNLQALLSTKGDTDNDIVNSNDWDNEKCNQTDNLNDDDDYDDNDDDDDEVTSWQCDKCVQCQISHIASGLAWVWKTTETKNNNHHVKNTTYFSLK